MANRAKVSPATISRIEASELMPSLAVFQRLVGAAGLYLVVVDQEGRVIEPAQDLPGERDLADRRYPAHIDRARYRHDGEFGHDEVVRHFGEVRHN
jgi:transcriptional regulator with XRE-family HTH domain